MGRDATRPGASTCGASCAGRTSGRTSTQIPRALTTFRGILKVSSAGTLVGLQVPGAGPNIELKPYAFPSVSTDNTTRPAIANDLAAHLGGDAKYGITPNMTADFTVRTDFAQVEVDEQQVNLTRFNLFFPEKRDFFLEGQGTFAFAGRPELGSQRRDR